MSSTSQQARPLAHIPELDGIRGLAIASVLALHTIRGAAVRVLEPWIRMGWVGVDLFFVLSGFLITRVLLHERESASYFKNFYARRILRIWPLYMTLTLLVFAVGWRLGPGLEFDHSARGLITYLAYAQNLAHPGNFGIWPLQVTWSLAIEEQFYLVWPFVVWSLGPRALRVACLAILAIEPVLRAWALHRGIPPITTYIFTPFRLDGLAAGAFVAIASRDGELPERILRKLLPVASVFVTAAGVVGLLWLGSDAVITETTPASSGSVIAGMALIFSCLAIGFSAFLGWVASSPCRDSMVHRFLRNRALRWLGKVSYGLYLFHGIVIGIAQIAVRRELEERFGLHGHRATLAVVLLEYAGSLSLAWLSFNYFEMRFLRLKNRFGGGPEASMQSVRPDGHAG